MPNRQSHALDGLPEAHNGFGGPGGGTQSPLIGDFDSALKPLRGIVKTPLRTDCLCAPEPCRSAWLCRRFAEPVCNRMGRRRPTYSLNTRPRDQEPDARPPTPAPIMDPPHGSGIHRSPDKGGRGRGGSGRTCLAFSAVADPQGLPEAGSTGQVRTGHAPPRPILPTDPCASPETQPGSIMGEREKGPGIEIPPGP
jgi:hypothetical protein